MSLGVCVLRKNQSAYLDLLRLGAALTVFVGHLSWKSLSGGFFWWFQHWGHDAVMVFFVLSGYVIQYAATKKETSFLEYEAARFARLYSVVLPALLLTLVCDQIGLAHNPASYSLDRETYPLLRLFAGGLFLSESWGWNLDLLNNDAFWSLPYEFWYYQIFAAFTFFTGIPRAVWVGVAIVIVGPAILVYFPIWLFGVVAFRAGNAIELSRATAAILFFMTALAIAGILLLDQNNEIARSDAWYLPPRFSILDFATGALVAINVFCATYARLPLARWAKPIAACAGITFSLYLFHLPLLHLLAAFCPPEWSILTRGTIMGSAVIVVVVLLSLVTEGKKGEWRALFRRLFVAVAAIPARRRWREIA